MRYDFIALVVLCVLIFFLLLLAAMISIQLMRTPDVDDHERISASRMTYFLLMAAMIYVSHYSKPQTVFSWLTSIRF